MASRREVEAAWLAQATSGGRDLEAVIRSAKMTESIARDAVKKAERGHVRSALDKVGDAQQQMASVEWASMWEAPEVENWARGDGDGWQQWKPSTLEDAATVGHQAAEHKAEVAQENALACLADEQLLMELIRGGPAHPCGFADCGFCQGQGAPGQTECKFGGDADKAKELMDRMLADARYACPGPPDAS